MDCWYHVAQGKQCNILIQSTRNNQTVKGSIKSKKKHCSKTLFNYLRARIREQIYEFCFVDPRCAACHPNNLWLPFRHVATFFFLAPQHGLIMPAGVCTGVNYSIRILPTHNSAHINHAETSTAGRSCSTTLWCTYSLHPSPRMRVSQQRQKIYTSSDQTRITYQLPNHRTIFSETARLTHTHLTRYPSLPVCLNL